MPKKTPFPVGVPEREDAYPVALTVAGSDSGGGAGIQADLRTFAAFGVYGCAAVTAVTAQNPLAVLRIDPIPAEGVAAQLEAIFPAFSVAAAKTGMLHDATTIRVVAGALAPRLIPVVVDPVMVAGSGAVLLRPEAIGELRDVLLPVAAWVTPNLPEAALLLDRPVADAVAMRDAALEISRRWDCGCVLKGGHALTGDEELAVDVVAHGGKAYRLSSPVVSDGAGHGTGCTFSAALAAALALRMPWREALAAAKAFVFGSLAEAIFPGPGLEAMYPPARNYIREIHLEPWS
jgi:hydroxymethylpyrimidine/phosphomethylpyrimidine kinase